MENCQNNLKSFIATMKSGLSFRLCFAFIFDLSIAYETDAQSHSTVDVPNFARY